MVVRTPVQFNTLVAVDFEIPDIGIMLPIWQ